MLSVLSKSWLSNFLELVGNSGDCLRICSPYIGYEPCSLLAEKFPVTLRDSLKFDLLTNLCRDNMVSRATDVRGLILLCDAFPRCDIRFLPQLHAKIYASDKAAIVTSANFTTSGFHRNLEYGIIVSDDPTVSRVFEDARSYHAIGTRVSRDELVAFDAIVQELAGLQCEMLKEVRQKARKAFEQISRSAEKQLLQIRAKSIGAHAGFAETIRFVLRKKEVATTQELYNEIQAIHTDLCDDSIKLVISGVEWSQAKWRHRVRHAQQFLSRRGEIMRENGRWRPT
jgi:hypothetical protein